MKKVILLLTMAMVVLCMAGSAFAGNDPVNANNLIVSNAVQHQDAKYEVSDSGEYVHLVYDDGKEEYQKAALDDPEFQGVERYNYVPEIKAKDEVLISGKEVATGIDKNSAGIADHKGKIERLDERVSLHTDDIIGNMDDIEELENKDVAHEKAITLNASGVKANAEGVTNNTRAVVGHEKRLDKHDVRLVEHDKHIKLNRADIDRNRADIENLYSDLDDLEEEMSEGISLAMAMQAPGVSQNKRISFSTGAGTYNGESALAGSVGIRLSENWQINAAAGAGLRTGKVGARAGITFEF